MTPPLLELRRQTKRRIEQQLFDGACANTQGRYSLLAQGRMGPKGPFGPQGGAG